MRVGNGACSATSRRARRLQRSGHDGGVETNTIHQQRRLDASSGGGNVDVVLAVIAMAHQSLNQASAVSAGDIATALDAAITSAGSDGSLVSAITARAAEAGVSAMLGVRYQSLHPSTLLNSAFSPVLVVASYYMSMLNVASSDALFPRCYCHFNLLQCFVGLNLDGRPESAANSNSVTFAISIARTKRATDSRADSDANIR